MRVLTDVQLTNEQLPLLAYRPGFTLIRGAAGSGKTTTAVLRLRAVTGVWRRQRLRTESSVPVRVLVLTYNRTLRGYVEQLVEETVRTEGLDLELTTFASWGWKMLGQPQNILGSGIESWGELPRLSAQFKYDEGFLADEVQYVTGRFLPDRLDDYANPEALTYDRRGRGRPGIESSVREAILAEVVRPYMAWKQDKGQLDWGDVAVHMATRDVEEPYDIVLIDEAQDFSANQVRAVVRHLAETHSTAFVLDAVQQIYPHGFRWNEVGVTFPTRDVHRLKENHRNTKQVAAFAFPLVKDLPLEDDGTLPDFESCTREGEMPAVVRGRFSDQMDWVVNRLLSTADGESTALLHARGGGWFSYVEQRLRVAGIRYVHMAGRKDWPQGTEQVGLCTLHSAKGLEFDHVVILGLNGGELMPHGADEDDGQLANYRRLVAMGVARARSTSAVTYKPGEASRVVDYLAPETFETIDV